MIASVLKELKNNKYRVSITRENILTLVENNRKILIERSVCECNVISNQEYKKKEVLL